MIHVELNIQRRHIIILAGILAAALLLAPGVSWASNRFSDVENTNIFHDDIAWLADAGVTLGCGDGSTFCPKDPVTREEMAAFMHRLSGDDSTTLVGRLDALEADNAALKALLAGVTRNGDTLLLTGMNLQVVNGAGTTDTTNSLGNVIIGYNRDTYTSNTRTGSHMLVVGDDHSYTSYGGIVAGLDNNTSGPGATVTGGRYNVASGEYASVSGGYLNNATGRGSSVSGGEGNTASGSYSSVSGGSVNLPSGDWATVSGGLFNTASGEYSTVSGGYLNSASGFYSSVSGGRQNTANQESSSVSGGYLNTASGYYSSVLGGFTNTAAASYSTIGGGDSTTCTSVLIAFCAEGFLSAPD